MLLAATTTAASAVTVTETITGSYGKGELVSVTFELGAGATFLDLITDGSLDANDGVSRADTLIALYAGTDPGAPLVAQDDDGGEGPASRIGLSGTVPGAGLYTLILGNFGFGVGADLGGVSFGGVRNVNYVLTIETDATLDVTGVELLAPVPLPASAALLGGGLALLGLGGMLRRRA